MLHSHELYLKRACVSSDISKTVFLICYCIMSQKSFRQLHVISTPWARTVLEKLVGLHAVNDLGERCAVMAA